MPSGERGVPCSTGQGTRSNEHSCYLRPMANQPPADDPAWEGGRQLAALSKHSPAGSTSTGRAF
jgi:hypothetical protein